MHPALRAVVLWISAFSAQVAFAADPDFALLRDRRAAIAPPAMSLAQRQQIVQQALLLLEQLYVHRDVRVKQFSDPLPDLRRLQQDLAKMTDLDFHAEMERIFKSQHDQHTNYIFPRPMNCFRTALPFSLVPVQSPGSAEPLLIVRTLVTDPKILVHVPRLNELVRPGDVLVAYDGLSTKEALESMAALDDGGNPGGSLRVRTAKLTTRHHGEDLAPSRDTVVLKFGDRTVELPWVTRRDNDCLAEAAKDLAPAVGRASRFGAKSVWTPNQETYESFYWKPKRRLPKDSPERVAPNFADLNDTAEPIVHWKKLVFNGARRIGYLKLDSFAPQKLNVRATVDLIAQLLLKDLADTEGLIIDLRDNGGGKIEMAESMIQLFTPLDVRVQNYRMLNTAQNLQFLTVSQIDSNFLQALRRTPPIDRFSSLTPLIAPAKGNDRGQAYFRGVALLTNGNCFSSCDMFASNMQDHGAAILIGEDATTGGGGANVVEQSFFFDAMPAGAKAPFVQLPNGLRMRISWRETIRVGREPLLELVGARSNVARLPSARDVLTNFSETAEFAARAALAQGQTRLAEIRLARDGRLDLPAAAAPKIAATVKATQRIDFLLDEKPLNSQSVALSRAGTPIELLPRIPEGAPSGMLKIVGSDARARVWRKFVSFRRVPEAGRVSLPFVSTQGGVAPLLMNMSSPATEGWTRLADGSFRVGAGPQYANNISTEASWFLDLGVQLPTRVVLDVELHSEKDFDFLTVMGCANGECQPLGALSGDQARQLVPFSIPEGMRRGGTLEIRLGFESDGNTVASGPVLFGMRVE